MLAKFGEHHIFDVGDRYSGIVDDDVVVDNKALVMVDGATLLLQRLPLQEEDKARMGFKGDEDSDLRVFGSPQVDKSDRWRRFDDAVVQLSEVDFPDWSQYVLWRLKQMRKRGYNPVSQSAQCAIRIEIGRDDRARHELDNFRDFVAGVEH